MEKRTRISDSGGPSYQTLRNKAMSRRRQLCRSSPRQLHEARSCIGPVRVKNRDFSKSVGKLELNSFSRSSIRFSGHIWCSMARVDALSTSVLTLLNRAKPLSDLTLRPRRHAGQQNRSQTPDMVGQPHRHRRRLLPDGPKNSCGLAVVVFEQPAQPLLTLDGLLTIIGRLIHRERDHVADALMRMFFVKMRCVVL